jgi:hypothetical protein
VEHTSIFGLVCPFVSIPSSRNKIPGVGITFQHIPEWELHPGISQPLMWLPRSESERGSCTCTVHVLVLVLVLVRRMSRLRPLTLLIIVVLFLAIGTNIRHAILLTLETTGSETQQQYDHLAILPTLQRQPQPQPQPQPQQQLIVSPTDSIYINNNNTRWDWSPIVLEEYKLRRVKVNQPRTQIRLNTLENVDFLLSKYIESAKSKLSVDMFVFEIG